MPLEIILPSFVVFSFISFKNNKNVPLNGPNGVTGVDEPSANCNMMFFKIRFKPGASFKSGD